MTTEKTTDYERILQSVLGKYNNTITAEDGSKRLELGDSVYLEFDSDENYTGAYSYE